MKQIIIISVIAASCLLYGAIVVNGLIKIKDTKSTTETIVTDTVQLKKLELDTKEKEQQLIQLELNNKYADLEKEKIKKDQEELEYNLMVEKRKQSEETLKRETEEIVDARNNVSVLFADLYNRAGKLKIQIPILIDELTSINRDIPILLDRVSEYKNTIVTNSYTVLDGRARIDYTKKYTRTPMEFVEVLKKDRIILSILIRYDNVLFKHELDKFVRNLEFENNRLKTSFALLARSRNIYGNKLSDANTSTDDINKAFEKELEKINKRIEFLKFRLSTLDVSSNNKEAKEQLKREIQDELGHSESSGLYAEKKRLEQMSKLSVNTAQHADASSSGICSNFDLQEKNLRDEYESNVKKCFDDIERSLLMTLYVKKENTEQMLKHSKDALDSIQNIISNYSNKSIDNKSLLKMNSKFKEFKTNELDVCLDTVYKK